MLEASGELARWATEASCDNWDGEGAAAMQQSTLRYATRLLWALPSSTPAPDVVVDRDGEVVFDWDRGPGRIFSISVGRDGTLTYAGIFGNAKTRGTEMLAAGVPTNFWISIDRVQRPA